MDKELADTLANRVFTTSMASPDLVPLFGKHFYEREREVALPSEQTSIPDTVNILRLLHNFRAGWQSLKLP